MLSGLQGVGVGGVLTVGASEHLHPQADVTAGVPVQRDEAQETSLQRVEQLVLDRALRVDVPDKPLQERGADGEQVSSTSARKHFSNTTEARPQPNQNKTATRQG